MATSHPFRFVGVALLVAFSAMSSGCYKNIAIRPDQIPLLSDMPGATVLQHTQRRTVLAVAVATVLTPEGTTVRIEGDYDLVLRLSNGQSVTFDHPVRSFFDARGALQIAGANRPAVGFFRSDIREAFVTQQDGVLSAVAGALVGVFGFLLAFGIVALVVF